MTGENTRGEEGPAAMRNNMAEREVAHDQPPGPDWPALGLAGGQPPGETRQ